ncbi:MAG TPA: histidinol-phosphate transaminase, partial [Gammaproteobacteria bacterium]|nr:histidinol-phosphate transaminase [Gammaproteobacteria bacterium]
RQELRAIRPYVPGQYEPGCIRLNANESPWRSPGDTTERGLNVYPPPRPSMLTAKLGGYYGVEQRQILVTRGSSEAIDVLIRGFCAAGRDSILITPPTFDMYRLYATIQNAGIKRVPLRSDFSLDVDKMLAAVDATTKIVFVCTPNNPTGQSMARPDVERLCAELAGRALVVIDEAYHEFASVPHFLELRHRYEHVVLLRTLSKFVSLAGVRCGMLIAAPEVVEFCQGVLPPYTFPTPSIELVMEALSQDSLRVSAERVATIKRERARLSAALSDVPQVLEVYPSDANFVMARTRDGAAFRETARRANILVRTFDDPLLADCVRITIGRPADNDLLLRALAGATERRSAERPIDA